MVKNHITIDDLLGFKQALLDDLVKILEQHQPVTIRRWLKPTEVMHVLGISRHKLSVLREHGTIIFRKVGDNYSYDYGSVMELNLSAGESPRSTVHSPQLDGKSRQAGDHSPQLYAGTEAEASMSQIQES